MTPAAPDRSLYPLWGALAALLGVGGLAIHVGSILDWGGRYEMANFLFMPFAVMGLGLAMVSSVKREGQLSITTIWRRSPVWSRIGQAAMLAYGIAYAVWYFLATAGLTAKSIEGSYGLYQRGLLVRPVSFDVYDFYQRSEVGLFALAWLLACMHLASYFLTFPGTSPKDAEASAP